MIPMQTAEEMQKVRRGRRWLRAITEQFNECLGVLHGEVVTNSLATEHWQEYFAGAAHAISVFAGGDRQQVLEAQVAALINARRQAESQRLVVPESKLIVP